MPIILNHVYEAYTPIIPNKTIQYKRRLQSGHAGHPRDQQADPQAIKASHCR